ncbi:MAG: ABC transporter permease subunit, partial [Gammaproteobacteria bacterium]|nr:ABC transporter permease subunit [Gammaproteobacteria bacterium]
GIPLGVLSAVRQNTLVDYGAMVLALFGISMPVFWIGIVAILFFSYYLPVFPATGLGDVN